MRIDQNYNVAGAHIWRHLAIVDLRSPERKEFGGGRTKIKIRPSSDVARGEQRKPEAGTCRWAAARSAAIGRAGRQSKMTPVASKSTGGNWLLAGSAWIRDQRKWLSWSVVWRRFRTRLRSLWLCAGSSTHSPNSAAHCWYSEYISSEPLSILWRWTKSPSHDCSTEKGW